MAGGTSGRDDVSVARRPRRRQVLGALGAGATLGLSGCAGLFGEQPVDETGSDPAADLSDVTLFADGEQVSLTIVYDSGSSLSEQVVNQLQSDVAQVGISLELEGSPDLREAWGSEPLPDENPDEFEWGPLGNNAGPPERTRTRGDWDLFWGIGGNAYPRTPSQTDAFFTRDGAANTFGYVPSADHRSLYAEAQQALDEQRRRELFSEIFGNVSEDLPVNVMSFSPDYWGFREDINTAPTFNEFGAEPSTPNRYRGDQSVSGDYIQLVTEALRNLYPPEITFTNDLQRIALLADGAYTIDTNDEVVPLWLDIDDPDDDGEVYVCTLRDNLQWGTDADGNDYGQMTAEDWVFQLESVFGVADDAADQWNEETPPSAQIGDFEAVENVTATGELEFQLELTDTDPVFPLRPVMWGELCLPKALYEQYMPDADALRQSPEIQEFTWTGNLGPYTFENRTPGEAGSFTGARNTDYYMRDHTTESNVQAMDEAWAEAPYFERYQLDTEEETSTATERFREGEGDAYQLPSENVQEFRETVESVRVEETPSPFITYLPFNMRANGHPLLKEQAGREAFALVIDKVRISEDIARGLTTPAISWQPEWSQYYDEDAVTAYGIDVTEDDIREARNLLDGLDGYSVEEA